ncbi:MAG: 50S ribosomal protein L17 [Tepidisphaeraceae bacterium]
MSRHRMFGRQLSRDTEHRTSLRRNLVQSLFEHGQVRTTLPRAQEVKAMAEKLIALARNDSVNARRRVTAILRDRRLTDEDQEFTGQTVVQKLFKEIAPQFADRHGGYTRIIKLSDYRIGDGGSLVLLQLLTEKSAPRGTIRRSAGLRRKRSERRHQFASRALKKTKEQDAQEAAAEAAGGPQSEPKAASAQPPADQGKA